MAIFTKDKDAPAPSSPPSPKQSAPSGPSSVIGPNLVIEGKIGGDQSLVIEGTVKGEIDLRSDVRIGPAARIEATVHARNVLVEGTVTGDLSADAKVELVATATVEGNIRSP
ncbi:MAG TPA: polymer-forming cytoskeletal protein, partial [Thermoanaerobaculia bacterium]